MSKYIPVTLALVISSLASFAGAAPQAQSILYSCTGGLNDQPHNRLAIIDDQAPAQTMEFGYGISSRLSLLKSGALGIEVIHGNKVVSSMVMKRGVTQFAMTAGGIEMNCYPRFNADFLR